MTNTNASASEALSDKEIEQYLYYRAVGSVEDYTIEDVRILVSTLTDPQRVRLNTYIRKYLSSPLPSEAKRSKTDRVVDCIARIIASASEESAAALAKKPSPIF